MSVEEQLAALRQAFLQEIDGLWQGVPDLSTIDNPRAQGIHAHHLDYTEQHKAMFLNEIASLGILYRHLHEEEAGHARKSARVYAELTGAPIPPEPDVVPHDHSKPIETMQEAPARPAAAPAPALRSAGLTVGSLKGRPQPEGDGQ